MSSSTREDVLNAGSVLDAPLPCEISGRIFADSDKLLITITPPAEGPRKPVVFIPVIDVSGSMGVAAAAEGTEGLGFSVLDLVKHATNTLASTLNAGDSMSVVTFSTTAKIAIPVTTMDNEGKDLVRAALALMEPDDTTNMWAGIELAAGLANDPAHAGKNIVIMVLTDGVSNVGPPRGIAHSLRAFPRLNPWSLHTFGFGYGVDSVLLTEVADIGGGLNGFVPDASMIGTVFINALAHFLSASQLPSTITVTGPGGFTATSQTGMTMYGQPRFFLYDLPPGAGAGPLTAALGGVDIPITCAKGDEDIPPFVAARHEFIGALQRALPMARDDIPEASAIMRSFSTRYAGSPDAGIQALVREVVSMNESEGQIGMALTPTHFRRWGQHHARAFLRSHILQHCMNFKDPSLQLYGGDVFHHLQEVAEGFFAALPPPIPYRRPERPGAGGPASLQGFLLHEQPDFSMSIFHNRLGGCFQGDARVLLADGVSRVAIQDLAPGTAVWTPSGPAAVRALVICHSTARAQPMTRLNDRLFVTPWHPVKDAAGEWTFPTRLAGFMDRLLKTVYNLVLTSGHIVDIEGVQAVTLAHGISGPVVGHPFFGSEAILRDLAGQPGWEEGRPVFNDLVVLRDPVTDQINGWRDAAKVLVTAAAVPPAADGPIEA